MQAAEEIKLTENNVLMINDRKAALESLVESRIGNKSVELAHYNDLPQEWKEKLKGIPVILGECMKTSLDVAEALGCASVVGVTGAAYGSLGSRVYWHWFNYKDGIYFDLQSKTVDSYNYEVRSYFPIATSSELYEIWESRSGLKTKTYKAEKAIRVVYRDFYKKV
jgi:hypothetical protein